MGSKLLDFDLVDFFRAGVIWFWVLDRKFDHQRRPKLGLGHRGYGEKDEDRLPVSFLDFYKLSLVSFYICFCTTDIPKESHEGR